MSGRGEFGGAAGASTSSAAASFAYDPFLPEVQHDPYPFYAHLRAHAPVYYVESLDAYAISRHADVHRVMHENVTFSSKAMADLVSRPVNAAGGTAFDAPIDNSISIIGRDGEDHARLRTIAISELLRTGVDLEPTGAMQRETSLVFRGPVALPLRFA